MDMVFEWDENKNIINQEKHKVSFDEARTVFYDEEARVIDDPEHEEYDFSDSKKNPYAEKLKKQITINIDSDTIEYFITQSKQSGIPYQTLINLYLSDCAAQNRRLKLEWN